MSKDDGYRFPVGAKRNRVVRGQAQLAALMDLCRA